MHRVRIYLQCGMQQNGCTKSHPRLQKARELHPDLRNNVHHAAFVTLLQAYEVRAAAYQIKFWAHPRLLQVQINLFMAHMHHKAFLPCRYWLMIISASCMTCQ